MGLKSLVKYSLKMKVHAIFHSDVSDAISTKGSNQQRLSRKKMTQKEGRLLFLLKDLYISIQSENLMRTKSWFICATGKIK